MKNILALLPLLAFGACSWGISDDVEPLGIGRDEVYIHAANFAREASADGQFKPRGDIDPWPLTLPLDWAADPFQEANWQFQLHSWRMTDPLLAAYFEDEDPAHLEAAMIFVEDWYDYHVEREETADYSWYDMAVGILALRIAFLIDATRSGEIEADRARTNMLNELAALHAENLKDWGNLNLGNHGLFQAAGLNLLCEVANHIPECSDGHVVAQEMFDKVMSTQFTSQGVHAENSPSYHFFVTNVARGIASLRRLGSEDWLEKADEVAEWLTLPDATVVPVGDSDGLRRAMTDDPEHTECLAAGQCFAVAPYNASGYGIVRSLPSNGENQSMLFVQGMAHNLVHKHADDLSFILYEFDRPIFIEGGKYGYKRDSWRRYVQSPASHNTIGLDRDYISPTTVVTHGSHIGPTEVSDGAFAIAGAYERTELFDHRRSFRYVPGVSLDIEDQIFNRTEDGIITSLHLAPDLEPILSGEGFEVDLGQKTLTAELRGDCEISLHRGEEDPILGWRSQSYLRVEPITTVRALCPANTTELGWSIRFD